MLRHGIVENVSRCSALALFSNFRELNKSVLARIRDMRRFGRRNDKAKHPLTVDTLLRQPVFELTRKCFRTIGSQNMNILIIPAETGEKAWTGFYKHLLGIEKISRIKKHLLTNNPHKADLILITDVKDDDDFRGLRIHPLLRQYPNKTFTIFEGDYPLRFVPGIYTSMPKSCLNLNRFRPGTYSYCHSRCGNPVNRMPPKARTGELFFSFMGRESHPLRTRLFNHNFGRSDVLIQNTSQFDWFTNNGPEREKFQNRYLDICMKSRFVLCPRGQGTSSIRLFEVMQMGLTPVIISDKWIPPVGPDWNSFSVPVKESRIEQLPEILTEFEGRWWEMGCLARKNWEEWFQIENEFNYIIDRLVEIKNGRLVDERIMRLSWPIILLKLHLRRRLSTIKRAVLGFF